MRVDVSICIATYRRPVGLVRLLGSLGRAKLPGGVGVEAIVVDNDPAADPARPIAADVSLPGNRLARHTRAQALLVGGRGVGWVHQICAGSKLRGAKSAEGRSAAEWRLFGTLAREYSQVKIAGQIP